MALNPKIDTHLRASTQTEVGQGHPGISDSLEQIGTGCWQMKKSARAVNATGQEQLMVTLGTLMVPSVPGEARRESWAGTTMVSHAERELGCCRTDLLWQRCQTLHSLSAPPALLQLPVSNLFSYQTPHLLTPFLPSLHLPGCSSCWSHILLWLSLSLCVLARAYVCVYSVWLCMFHCVPIYRCGCISQDSLIRALVRFSRRSVLWEPWV